VRKAKSGQVFHQILRIGCPEGSGPGKEKEGEKSKKGIMQAEPAEGEWETRISFCPHWTWNSVK